MRVVLSYLLALVACDPDPLTVHQLWTVDQVTSKQDPVMPESSTDCRRTRMIGNTSGLAPLIAAGPKGYLIVSTPEVKWVIHIGLYNENGDYIMHYANDSLDLQPEDTLIGTENGFILSAGNITNGGGILHRFDVDGHWVTSKALDHPWVFGGSGPHDPPVLLTLGTKYDDGHDLLVFPHSTVGPEWSITDTLHFSVVDRHGNETTAWKYETHAKALPISIAVNRDTIAVVLEKFYTGPIQSEGYTRRMMSVLTMNRDGSGASETMFMNNKMVGQFPLAMMRNGEGFLLMTGKEATGEPFQWFFNTFKVVDRALQVSDESSPIPDGSSGLVAAPGGQFRTLVPNVDHTRFRVVTLTDTGSVTREDVWIGMAPPYRGIPQLVAMGPEQYAVLWIDDDDQLLLYTNTCTRSFPRATDP